MRKGIQYSILDSRSSMIIAFDLDGTLLRSDKTISERTDRALDTVQRRGHRVVVATARPPRTTEELLGNRLPQAPRIYYTGALVVVDGNRIHDRTIPVATAQHILTTLATRAPVGAPISYEIDDHLYANQPLTPYHGMPLEHTVVDLAAPLDGSPVKIILDLTRIDDPKPILAGLPDEVRCVVADGVIAMIMARDVNKAAGIGIVLDVWAESFDNVIAIGDDLSDRDMIERAAVGIAMENGHEEIKAVADRIALANDDDGVAIILEQMIEEGLLA